MPPRAPVKAPPRPRRSKAEIQQEFAGIQAEVSAAKEALQPKAEEAARMHEADVRKAVEGVSVDAVVHRISELGLQVSGALAQLSEKLVREVQSLTSAREAVELERAELERLHKLDVAAAALDQMLQDFAREKERLEAETNAQRAAWEEEARAKERERKEYDENLRKQRQREAEDFEYKKSIERKKAQDKYEEEMRLLEKKNQEKQEALEKRWQQREAALKDSEEELLRLRKEAAELPERLKREAEQAAAQATRAAESRLQQELTLLKKDRESEKQLAELQIKTLQEALARESEQMAALHKQLDEAKRQVQEIAVKAIEGASGAQALAHVDQIAMEQAKGRTPQS